MTAVSPLALLLATFQPHARIAPSKMPPPPGAPQKPTKAGAAPDAALLFAALLGAMVEVPAQPDLQQIEQVPKAPQDAGAPVGEQPEPAPAQEGEPASPRPGLPVFPLAAGVPPAQSEPAASAVLPPAAEGFTPEPAPLPPAPETAPAQPLPDQPACDPAPPVKLVSKAPVPQPEKRSEPVAVAPAPVAHTAPVTPNAAVPSPAPVAPEAAAQSGLLQVPDPPSRGNARSAALPRKEAPQPKPKLTPQVVPQVGPEMPPPPVSPESAASSIAPAPAPLPLPASSPDPAPQPEDNSGISPVGTATVSNSAPDAGPPSAPAPLAFSARLVPIASTAVHGAKVSAAATHTVASPAAAQTHPAEPDRPAAAPSTEPRREAAPHPQGERKDELAHAEAQAETRSADAPRPQPEIPGSSPAAPSEAIRPAARAETAPPEPPAPEKPAAPAAREAIARPPDAPVRDINLHLAGQQHVAVRLVERSGEVQVSVRTPDPHLADALRENLPSLGTRLEAAGFRPESPHATPAPAETRREAASAASSPHQPGAQADSDGGKRHHEDTNPKTPPRAETKQKGKPFSWLMSSLT